MQVKHLLPLNVLPLTREAIEKRQALIIRAVASQFEVTEQEFFRKTRLRKYCVPRQVVAWLLYKTGYYNTVQIGQIFNQGHNTIMSGIITVQNRLETEDDFADRVSNIQVAIKEDLRKYDLTA